MNEETRDAPAPGNTDPRATDLTPGDEPNTTGTLFLTFVLLVIIGGIWVMVYQLLLHR